MQTRAFRLGRLVRSRRLRWVAGSLCAATLMSAALVAPGFSEQQIQSQQYNLPNFGQLIKQYDDAVVSLRVTGEASPAGDMPNMDMPEDIPEPFKKFFENGPGKRFFFGPPQGQPHPFAGEGSGFIISSDGYLLTNAHVVDHADNVTVRLNDRREYKAKVVGVDERSDVALLKIDASGLPTVKVGNSDRIDVGDWVLAIGSPFGFESSATQGIVSAVGRSLPDGTYVPFIQTDAAVNPGNSGGPLFNLQGEVIGINSQIYSRSGGYQGLSFAIPINLAMDVVQQLKDKGYVSRGWLGVMIQDLNQNLAKSFGMDKPAGALVSQVLPNSPAAKAGIEVGDVILSYNGQPLESSSELPPLVGDTRIGDKADLQVLRNGSKRDLTVTIGQLENQDEPTQLAQADQQGQKLGVAVAELSPEQRQQLGVERGVLVRGVQNGSPAAQAGLQRGDVILSFNNHEVENSRELINLVEQAPKDKPSVILVARNQGRLFLPIELG